MKWFRHESRANRDAKLAKLLIKYGYEGYGLYWYCLENICAGLEPDLTFELEHDSEILSHAGGMDSRKVEEVMRYMVSLGLFEMSDNTVTCLKLARFLGESGTRNKDLRQIIKSAKSENVSDSPRLSQTVSDCHRQSQIVSLREDKIREDNNTPYLPLARLMAEKIQPITKQKEIKVESWADDLRKLCEIDGRTLEEVERVFLAAHRDPFWQTNILSAAKLRKQFPTLTAKFPPKKTGSGVFAI